jgi:hypothetical protein
LHFHVFLTTVKSILKNLGALYVEVYPIEVNPLELHLIEAYSRGKVAVEVSGFSLGYIDSWSQVREREREKREKRRKERERERDVNAEN